MKCISNPKKPSFQGQCIQMENLLDEFSVHRAQE